jgi:hypothetical protein
MKNVAAVFVICVMPVMVGIAGAQNVEYVNSTFWTGVNDIKIVGDYAYCAFVNGLTILDVSDSTNPAFVSHLRCPGHIKRMDLSGSYAYMAGDSSGLQIFDVSDPANPVLSGNCQMPGAANDVFVSGNYAYVANRDSSLRVIDVSDPSNPVIAGACGFPYTAQAVYVLGSYAYVAMEWANGVMGAIKVVDISDPSNPSVFMSSAITPIWAARSMDRSIPTTTFTLLT